tara:strand:- start:691 stop:1098 length:408 start_codon:yes stop_codon:yes gene_type:complete
MASQLKVDTITGVTTAGAINVTLEGSETGVLQEGLAKMWCIFNGTSNAILDSINSASLTDNGTGEYAVNYTNAFSSADKYVSFMSADENNSSNFCRIGTLQAQAASSGKVICSLASDCAVKDCARVHKMNHGELA